MMRSRFVYTIPALLLAILAIGIAIYGLMFAPKPVSPPLTPHSDAAIGDLSTDAEATYSYLIALQSVDAGETLAPELLSRFELGSELEGAVPADEIGHQDTLKRGVRVGEVITQSMYEYSTRIQPILEDGARAMAFEWTPLTSIGGLIRPEDYVDVYGTFRAMADEEPVSVEIIRNVKVLAVQGSIDVDSEQNSDNQRRNQTMVLAIPRDEVPRLALASIEARLSFAATGSTKERVAVTDDASIETLHDLDPEGTPEEPLAAFFSDIRPSQKSVSEKNSTSETRRNEQSEEQPGREVRIFEGSSTRSVYVQ